MIDDPYERILSNHHQVYSEDMISGITHSSATATGANALTLTLDIEDVVRFKESDQAQEQIPPKTFYYRFVFDWNHYQISVSPLITPPAVRKLISIQGDVLVCIAPSCKTLTYRPGASNDHAEMRYCRVCQRFIHAHCLGRHIESTRAAFIAQGQIAALKHCFNDLEDPKIIARISKNDLDLAAGPIWRGISLKLCKMQGEACEDSRIVGNITAAMEFGQALTGQNVGDLDDLRTALQDITLHMPAYNCPRCQSII